MKRFLVFTIATLFAISFCQAGMSSSKVRRETRFLTDRMAYELKLSTHQYNDVYEINYDFINGIRHLTNDILRGYDWAFDRYYEYLDMRNDDLRWVLTRGQFRQFMRTEYFFRPAYMNGRNWIFRVYICYKDHEHYYYPKPHHYNTYHGAHSRYNHKGESYYHGRYSHPTYNLTFNIRNDKSYKKHWNSDFKDIKRHHGNKRYERDDDDDDDDDDRKYPSREYHNRRPRKGSSTESRSLSTGIKNYTQERTNNTRPSNNSRKQSSRKKENR